MYLWQALHVTNEISSYKRSKKQKVSTSLSLSFFYLARSLYLMLLGNILQIFLDLKDAENFQLKERLNLQKVFFSLFLNICFYQNRIPYRSVIFSSEYCKCASNIRETKCQEPKLEENEGVWLYFNTFPFSLFFFFLNSADLETWIRIVCCFVAWVLRSNQEYSN